MQAAHDQSLVVGLDRQLGVGAGPQDRPDLRRRQDHRARLLDFDAQHPVANPNLQVRSHEHRALIGFGDELDVLEDRLGAPGWNNPADHPERREQCLTVAQGPHSNPLISNCSRRGREKCTAVTPLCFIRSRHEGRENTAACHSPHRRNSGLADSLVLSESVQFSF